MSIISIPFAPENTTNSQRFAFSPRDCFSSIRCGYDSAHVKVSRKLSQLLIQHQSEFVAALKVSQLSPCLHPSASLSFKSSLHPPPASAKSGEGTFFSSTFCSHFQTSCPWRRRRAQGATSLPDSAPARPPAGAHPCWLVHPCVGSLLYSRSEQIRDGNKELRARLDRDDLEGAVQVGVDTWRVSSLHVHSCNFTRD
jgi:hypothetical protein